MDYYPALLLIHARNSRGVSGLDADELREIARRHWPSMAAEWIDRVVDQAIRQRGQGQRRIDPATVNLKHPAVREKVMMEASRTAKGPSKKEVGAFVRTQVQAEPEIDNDELHRRARKHFEADVSRARTSAFGRKFRDEQEADPAPSNGKGKPERAPKRKAVEVPPPEVKPRTKTNRAADGRLGNTIQVSEDLDASVRLFVDLSGLDKAVAHRAAAAIHAALAG